jgi:hypothetical protein
MADPKLRLIIVYILEMLISRIQICRVRLNVQAGPFNIDVPLYRNVTGLGVKS